METEIFTCKYFKFGRNTTGLSQSHLRNLLACSITHRNYGLETVVSVLFSNTRTRLLYNERGIFNTARSEAECSIENFEFIVQ